MSEIITQVSFNDICRLCLSPSGVMSEIFDYKRSHDSVSLPQRIMACASVKVQLGDGLPSQICRRCIRQLKNAYEFKELCENSDSTLHQILSEQMSQDISVNQEMLRCEADVDNSRQAEGGNFIPNFLDLQEYLVINPSSNVDKEEECNSPFVINGSVAACNVEIVKVEPSDNSSEEGVIDNELVKEFAKENVHLLAQNMNALTGTISQLDVEAGLEYARNFCTLTANTGTLPPWNGYIEIITSDLGHTDSRPERDAEYCDLGADLLFLEDKRSESEFESLPLGRDCEGGVKPSEQDSHTNTVVPVNPAITMHDGFKSSVMRQKKKRKPKERQVFTCKICSKSFSERFNLNKHEMIHVGEKPYICYMCAKPFLRKDHLLRHEKSHSGEKNFSCPFCNRMYAEKHSVKKHLKVHTETHQPYQRKYPHYQN